MHSWHEVCSRWSRLESRQSGVARGAGARCTDSESGFKGVIRMGGKERAAAEAAAARGEGPQRLTAEEARVAAAREGLELEQAAAGTAAQHTEQQPAAVQQAVVQAAAIQAAQGDADGQATEETEESDVEIVEAQDEVPVPADELPRWRSIELVCIASRQRLVDPAKGSGCRHDANCNFDQLQSYVRSKKKCPMATCDARISCRSLERDEKMKDLLKHFSSDAEKGWLRDDDEVRLTNPAGGKRRRMHADAPVKIEADDEADKS